MDNQTRLGLRPRSPSSDTASLSALTWMLEWIYNYNDLVDMFVVSLVEIEWVILSNAAYRQTYIHNTCTNCVKNIFELRSPKINIFNIKIIVSIILLCLSIAYVRM